MAHKLQRIRVLRPFQLSRDDVVFPDSVLDVDLSFAVDMRGANKAEFVAADTPLKRVGQDEHETAKAAPAKPAAKAKADK